MPTNTVKVDRTTPFGNPFSVKEHGRDRALALHRARLAGEIASEAARCADDKNLMQRREAVLKALPALRGKNLACWCPLAAGGEPDKCHAALLLAFANA